jgi:hypothetical protein
VAILLTGFAPFLPAVDTYLIGNSSQKIVECFINGPGSSLDAAVSNELAAVKANVSPRILPVRQGSSGDAGASAGALANLLAAEQPTGILCLGHFLPIIGDHLPFTGAHSRLELVAYRPKGLTQGDVEKRSWFANLIATDAQQHGIAPSDTSEFRARGPCNDTYWTALEWGGAQKPVVFLHLPPFVTAAGQAAVLQQVLFVIRRELDQHR